MREEERDVFLLSSADDSAYHALIILFFSECIHLDLPHLLLIFSPNSYEHKVSHTLSSFILCSYPHLSAPLSLSGSPCASGSL